MSSYSVFVTIRLITPLNRTITYSPAYTLVPTYECFNRCSYCNFRVQPGEDTWLTVNEAKSRLIGRKVIEVLILSGEVHPESSRRLAWFKRIYELCQLALQTGFLPHTNAGPLSFEEMGRLKQVNVSMGLMLEQLTPTLMQGVHRHAPSKQPQLRLEQLKWAGQLRIPFTTGLLLGIGETETDWEESLDEIATLQTKYEHIQEVILQPHQPGKRQTVPGPSFDDEKLLMAVKLARQILPESITIQIPPNLVQSSERLIHCLDAGVRDLGGLVPLDEVNPSYPHHQLETLSQLLHNHGYQLQPRLPVYPQYDSWLPPSLQTKVQSWRARLDLNGMDY